MNEKKASGMKERERETKEIRALMRKKFIPRIQNACEAMQNAEAAIVELCEKHKIDGHGATRSMEDILGVELLRTDLEDIENDILECVSDALDERNEKARTLKLEGEMAS